MFEEIHFIVESRTEAEGEAGQGGKNTNIKTKIYIIEIKILDFVLTYLMNIEK